MQIFSGKNTINFMKLSLPAAVLSSVLVLGSFVTLAVNQLNWGLDFTGGTQIEIGYQDTANLDAIREQLAASEFNDAVVVKMS
jgi:preprotein translocase subunit SecF